MKWPSAGSAGTVGSCVVFLGSAQPLLAQETRPSLLAIDTVASFDESADFSDNYATGAERRCAWFQSGSGADSRALSGRSCSGWDRASGTTTSGLRPCGMSEQAP